jgi:hypothetical protein
MPRLSKEKVDAAVLAWARSAFEEELRTDFRRAGTFDDPFSQNLIEVFLRRPKAEIQILAEVLPLGVFWETPTSQQKRDLLPTEARQAVERLRRDYDRHCMQHQTERLQRLQRIRGKHDEKVEREFKRAVRNGSAAIETIANRWKCQIGRASPGEWGLIQDTNWGRWVVSLNLSRGMVLSYSVSIFDSELLSVRFHDNYLVELGLGSGFWNVENAEVCAEKLLTAMEFARWHVDEYEGLIKDCL